MSQLASTQRAPRILRSLPWISALVLFAGIIAFSIAYFGRGEESTADRFAPPPPVAQQAPTVKLDRSARVAAGKFITSAVTRQDLRTGWNLTHPSLKAGYTLKEWMKGSIPVQYYPPDAIAGATFKVEESHPRQATLRVLILPTTKAAKGGLKPGDSFITLTAVGNGEKKRWLVSYWVPASGGGMVPNVGAGAP